MSNIKPPTTVTVIDPKVLKAIEDVKADTEAIKARLDQDRPAPAEPPRYFPRGYFP